MVLCTLLQVTSLLETWALVEPFRRKNAVQTKGPNRELARCSDRTVWPSPDLLVLWLLMMVRRVFAVPLTIMVVDRTQPGTGGRAPLPRLVGSVP